MSEEVRNEEREARRKERYKSEHKLKVLTYHLLSKLERETIKTKSKSK